MAQRLTDYIDPGKALDQEEREITALALQQVDKAEQAEIDAAWNAEINSRLVKLMSGVVEPVSGRETLAKGRAILAQRRSTGR